MASKITQKQVEFTQRHVELIFLDFIYEKNAIGKPRIFYGTNDCYEAGLTKLKNIHSIHINREIKPHMCMEQSAIAYTISLRCMKKAREVLNLFWYLVQI